MTPVSPDVGHIKEIHRRILEILEMIYDRGMTCEGIMRCVIPMSPDYSLTLLRKDLAFLKEKGYIEFIDERIGGFDDYAKKVAKITADGIERVRRIIVDPALEI